MKLAALVVILSGCVVVPKTTRTVREVERGARETKGPLGDLAVQLAPVDGAVNIAVGRERTCVREHYVDVETKIGKTGELKGPDGGGSGNIGGDPRGLVIVALAVPVILAASGLITAIVVAASKDKTEVHRTVKRVESFDCTVRRPVTARIELPSGATVELTSDASGKTGFAIPETEPDVGVVRVTSGNATTLTRYFRTTETCLATRGRELADANTRDLPQRRQMIEQLPACGRHTSKAVAFTERNWELTRKAVLTAMADRCDEALALGWRLHERDRVHHDSLLVTQPDVAACFRKIQQRKRSADAKWEPYERRQRDAQAIADTALAARTVQLETDRDACLKSRAKAMRIAQTIAEPQARGRALTAIPVCR